MRKLVLVGLLALPLTANSIGWNTIAGLNKERVKVDHEYKIKTSGNEPRVYEWTPKDNRSVTCLFVAGTKSSGVACYKKENK